MFSNKNDLSSVKIADFGLATYYEADQDIKCGTYIFMAPEIINKEKYNQVVDIWATGIILFILCSGGKHPLYTTNLDTELYIQQIKKKPDWNFPTCFPLLARNLFIKLCKYNRVYRYQATNAMRHPWITRSFKSDIPLTFMDSLSQMDLLKKFRTVKLTIYCLSY